MKNEKLYPGNSNPEDSYEIDLIMEDATDFFVQMAFMLPISPGY